MTSAKWVLGNSLWCGAILCETTGRCRWKRRPERERQLTRITRMIILTYCSNICHIKWIRTDWRVLHSKRSVCSADRIPKVSQRIIFFLAISLTWIWIIEHGKQNVTSLICNSKFNMVEATGRRISFLLGVQSLRILNKRPSKIEWKEVSC